MHMLPDLEEAGLWISLDAKRQRITALNEQDEKVFDYRPPLPAVPIAPDQTLEGYLSQVQDEPGSYLILLMQAGAASLGLFEEGEVTLHKAIKKYMVRKKQGKAQLNYLQTRGKSKAGSRIRLANTTRFLEEINEYLQKWEAYEPAERILYYCNPQLWGLLHQAQPAPPFDKKDARLAKVPFDVHTPDHEELLRINRKCLQAELRVYLEDDRLNG